MKNLYLKVCFLFIIPCFINAQNQNVSPESQKIGLTLKLNNNGLNNKSDVLGALSSFSFVNHVETTASNEVNVVLNVENQILPDQMYFDISNSVNQYVSNILFSNNEEILDVFKRENVLFKSIRVSGLSTKSDANQLRQQLLSDAHILSANPNFETHELFIVYVKDVSNNDFNNLIMETGKNIINSDEEIAKYY